MSSRLISSSFLFAVSRGQPWLCAQCACFSSSTVTLKAKSKIRASGGRGSSKRSSRTQFGTTSRTRLVKDLKPKARKSTSESMAKGKFEVAPKRTSSTPRASAFERSTAPHQGENKAKPYSKAAAERANVEALLDAEFDRSTGSSSKSSKANPQELLTTFGSPPLLSGLRQSIHDILGPDPRPTPIQALALKHLFPLTSTQDNWREFLLASETGSGKSFAYLLPLLQYLKQTEGDAAKAKFTNTNLLNPRSLVLAPTHELTRQLSAFAKSLIHHVKLRVLCASRANVATHTDRRQGVVASLTSARQMKHALSSLGEGEGNEISIDGKSQGSKDRPVDVFVSTPVKALEMVRGWGWGKVKEEQAQPWEKEGKIDKPFKLGKSEMSLQRVECVVVDEADVLFDPDFRQTTLDLLSDISMARGHPIPSDPKQIAYPFHLILTSATIPASLSAYLTAHHPTLTRLASPHLHRLPATLATEHISTTGGGSSGQRFADVERRLRRVWAEDALRGPDAKTGKVTKSKVLVFCNKSSTVERLGEYLREKGIENVALTSASATRTRGSNKHIEPFLKGFEDGASNAKAPNVLVTTSLLSRGLDFSAFVKHVFIVDAPRNMVDFLHRAGRAARAGQQGRVVVFGKLKGRGSSAEKDVRRKVQALAH